MGNVVIDGSDSVADGLGAVAGKSGPVVDPFPFAVAGHGWQVQQHREPGRALNQRPDRGTPNSEDQVTFPVSWNRPVISLGWSFADHDLRCDELAASLAGPRPRDPQRSPGTKTRHQLPPQPTSTLHIKRLVDGLVRDPHGLIMGEIDPEPVRDLLRTPRLRPPTISPPAVMATRPLHFRPWHHPTVRVGDHPTQTIPHIPAQFVVGRQLGDLRAAGTPLSVPLRRRGPIDHPTTAG